MTHWLLATMKEHVLAKKEKGWTIKSPCGRTYFLPLLKVKEDYAEFLVQMGDHPNHMDAMISSAISCTVRQCPDGIVLAYVTTASTTSW